jgi:hypothetical protein
MDNVGVVVVDLAATIEFFRELGLELEGQAVVGGERASASPGSATSASRSRWCAHSTVMAGSSSHASSLRTWSPITATLRLTLSATCA